MLAGFLASCAQILGHGTEEPGSRQGRAGKKASSAPGFLLGRRIWWVPLGWVGKPEDAFPGM